MPNISRIKTERDRNLSVDSYSDDADRLIELTRALFIGIYSDSAIRALITETALSISNFNRRQFSNSGVQLVGIDFRSFEQYLQPEIDAFVSANVDLIRSIESVYFDDVKQILLTEIRNGSLISEIARKIEKRGLASSSRAKFIARDQVGKFNGSLTELRQQSLGVDSYIWRTSRDERVRGRPGGRFPDANPSHWAREGKVFKWSDPPSGGHPGQDYACRCTAEAIIDESSQI